LTYSVVARDPVTGELGVAVQSHYFQVGATVPWAEPGLGAIASQSMAEPRYGTLGLELMRGGYSPEQALAAVRSADPEQDSRQVAMIDSQGRVAVHTGARCIPEAGHRVGEGFSAQANLMARDTVWDAMAGAFEASTGPLAERMLAALDAAEAEGGDIRGKQSAAILVVAATPTGLPFEDRPIDIRVEDHPDPLVEMRRLLRLKRAYQASSAGFRAGVAGDAEKARERRLAALEIAPELVELRFFAGLGMATAGDLDGGAELLRPLMAGGDHWMEAMRRLVRAGRLDAGVAGGLEGRLKQPSASADSGL
jgi:uncharacterized Ntn-hydrolase superfamily protein